MKPFWIIWFGILALLPVSGETLKDKDGRAIEVDIQRVDDQWVWFTRKGGTNLTKYSIAKLSEESAALLREWEPAASTRFEIDFASGKRNQKNNYNDIDDRTYTLSPEIKIANKDADASTAAGTATIILFGRPALYRGDLCVLYNESVEFPAVPPFRETEIEGKKIEFGYDDTPNGEMYGARYTGYALILEDEEGAVIFRKAVPEKYAKFTVEQLKGLEVGVLYSSELRKKKVRIRLR